MNTADLVSVDDTDIIDELSITNELIKRRPLYSALAAEARFILESGIERDNIKIHSIETRIKDIRSVIDKCKRKEIADPFNKMNDLVGARVICLFRSDLEKINTLLMSEFTVTNVDDKISESSDSFGYMSIHYIVTLKSSYSGPRYDKIKGIPMEIQIRTISMHAWASISHYLAYKGDWDVPLHLKKSLNALSGLFYVADGEFERFYNESLKSRQEPANEGNAEEINLDTITTLLGDVFPNRRANEPRVISDLVQQIKDSGYHRISEIKNDIARASSGFDKFEASIGKGPGFARVGAARVSLNLVNKQFYYSRDRKSRDRKSDEPPSWYEFALWRASEPQDNTLAAT